MGMNLEIFNGQNEDKPDTVILQVRTGVSRQALINMCTVSGTRRIIGDNLIYIAPKGYLQKFLGVDSNKGIQVDREGMIETEDEG
jgi:hypothetical protein